MRKKPAIIDTNLLIRYFTADDKNKANAVEKLFKSAPKESLELTDVAIAEIVWVLLSFYQISKKEVVEKLEGILSLENLKLNRLVLRETIDIYQKYNISFIDAYLAAYAIKGSKSAQLYTFDKRLNKISQLKILKP